jgi:hypothetical protein
MEYPDGAIYAKYLHKTVRKEETTREKLYFNQSDHRIQCTQRNVEWHQLPDIRVYTMVRYN